MPAQPPGGSTVVSDWIPAAMLAGLVGSDLKTVYNQHSCGRGPLAPILTKLGGRLGCWREDYEAWKVQQRRLGGAEQQPHSDRVPAAGARVTGFTARKPAAAAAGAGGGGAAEPAAISHAEPRTAGVTSRARSRLSATQSRRVARK